MKCSLLANFYMHSTLLLRIQCCKWISSLYSFCITKSLYSHCVATLYYLSLTLLRGCRPLYPTLHFLFLNLDLETWSRGIMCSLTVSICLNGTFMLSRPEFTNISHPLLLISPRPTLWGRVIFSLSETHSPLELAHVCQHLTEFLHFLNCLSVSAKYWMGWLRREQFSYSSFLWITQMSHIRHGILKLVTLPYLRWPCGPLCPLLLSQLRHVHSL
jgi:hypothetical protein